MPDARDPELEITLLSIRRAKPGLSVTGASGVGGMLQCLGKNGTELMGKQGGLNQPWY